ncbi:hypothetical protein OQA88_9982 [Cercophora sp. LCS_1]
MRSSLLTLYYFATLAVTTPLVPRSKVGYTTVLWSNAFLLIANVTNLSMDLDPSVHLWKLNGVHNGAGAETAILTKETGRIFYENGTDDNIGVTSDTNGPYPSSMVIHPLTPDQPYADYVDNLGINLGMAMRGLGIVPYGEEGWPWPSLYSPDDGTFMACPGVGAQDHQVRFAKGTVDADGNLSVAVPLGCAPVTLLAQCMILGNAPAGATYTHDYARQIRCYEDVSNVDWSME